MRVGAKEREQLISSGIGWDVVAMLHGEASAVASRERSETRGGTRQEVAGGQTPSTEAPGPACKTW